MTPDEFLTARLDEQEAEARSAIAARERAHVHPSDKGPQTFPPADASDDADLGTMEVGPEWVLADVAAKRAILAEFQRDPNALHNSWGLALEWTLKSLAAVYADHPDFDPAWRL